MQTLAQLKCGVLEGCTSLKLSEGLTSFPIEIFSLSDTLEYLDLSSNNLSELPKDFGRLKKLKVFFCSDNSFDTYPQVLADCPQLDIVGFKANRIQTIPDNAIGANLRWLILTNNQVSAIPAAIGQCYRLEKLMLAGNQLTALPDELQNCKALALLRLSANEIDIIPEWLFSLPKLSWLAFAGNPCTQNAIAEIEAPVIAYNSLQIKDRLGEGASGTIYRASRAGILHDVAVKVFKGDVTSDGYPEDEMSSSLQAGEHDALVKILGTTDNIVESKTGLVMELIPKHYVNLGNPPSLKSCTRDVFDPNVQFSAQQIINILTSISSVANHLHERGIMHGDLYAHNMLIDDEGNTLFGDFGAATRYERTELSNAYALEKIEVSAFGYLVDDLLSLYPSNKNDAFSLALQSLKERCLSTKTDSRPNFEEIESKLAEIKLSV
ncbi:leucine-rich repeat-containing protein kinase family protein [Pedobacter sp. CFBP9032]|uniref:leucine-rich repeat-containing protein kinase family protein n=1 Tax=Pedobacter sp. CFBP9032 TaxID=3096539 RepID=UPI002A69D05A|nr:leucine-rich repeat-containing protein kinase family protein [Pedobacter sp. CFBP9032]MDY0906081.1 leucine-rich repeat-containing protein kinase family protein [Pedobacter sp. CFBP9032]